VFLEIRTFRFLSILKNKKNRERIIKYFIVQTMSSIVLLLSVRVNIGLERFEVDSFYLPPILILSLIVKRGVAPTHVWMPSVIQSIPWVGVLLLLTAQKLAPLYLMVKNSAIEQIIMIILLSRILGTFSQLSSLNVKTILMYSSVAHSR
jgi:NADH:ubiquinone oxidoreductase subunit 2 (subunit N)